MNIYTLTGRGDEVGETRWRRQGGGDVEEESRGRAMTPKLTTKESLRGSCTARGRES
jgi:hypothetical protein